MLLDCRLEFHRSVSPDCMLPGQFICGNKKCSETSSLRTWEVNFGYVENQEKKNALVKLRKSNLAAVKCDNIWCLQHYAGVGQHYK